MKNLNEYKKALFIIDMNNGFCEEGNLADKSIKKIIPNIIENTEKIIKEEEALFIVNDNHNKDSIELKRYLEHCTNKEESETVKELKPYEEYATNIFHKNSTCALFAEGVIDTLMNMNNLNQVIIVGCCTDICIINFAISLRCLFDELNLDIDIVIPKDSVETYNIPTIHDRDEYNERSYKIMEEQGIKLVKKLDWRKKHE